MRAISNLETPPADRLAVETRVTRFSDELIRHAIMRELNRGGQIYFVHNRINDIHAVAARLQPASCPRRGSTSATARWPEHELEDVMLRFVRGETDILLSTTIVESGLDIPNANTMFIDDADRYGLADLHQLRGRVGRYKHRAYCYLLVDENRHLSPEAARRLRAIEEFSQMGAGFALAMRDLELRGAGNILGTQQSGHIATVGYELYCALLERAVRQAEEAAAAGVGRREHRPAGRGVSAARLRARHAVEDRSLPPAGAADDRGGGRRFCQRAGRPVRPAAGGGASICWS